MSQEPKGTLYYVDGSPFARLIRVLVREWTYPTTEVKLPFPLPDDFFDLSPLGQVPVLRTKEKVLFPTAAIASHLSEATGQKPYDTQLLAALLSWADSLVAAFYQEWAGLVPVPKKNALGFDPATCNLERVGPFLDWVAQRIDPKTPGAPEFALGCILNWVDSRRPIDCKHPEVITELIRRLGDRASFQETVPAPWSAD
ncbi:MULTISPECIES: glutathione S-transferase family protein [unclassified Roseovarius]|uniref:glutathione S-transferase family protein n=1 Tax=unclassified Roseovarius TaxID=2614913 RepID=UPI00273DB111|nr:MULTISPECIES: glutathione S-transferase family protein [unclassified Roseovarius]